MDRDEYKVYLGGESKGSIRIGNEEELSYNLKGIAETEFMKDYEFGARYKSCADTFSLIFRKTGEGWEEDFGYEVAVYDKNTQKIVRRYRFNIERISSVEATFEDYKGRQQRIFDNKVNHGFNTTNVYQEARYILEEVAELMRAVEKEDKENIIEELADIVIFSYGCAAVAGVGDLDTKIFEKMKINENREYTKNAEGDFVKK
jgi:NTP pyrophosphatase (non-canonical NTP hydrolase)